MTTNAAKYKARNLLMLGRFLSYVQILVTNSAPGYAQHVDEIAQARDTKWFFFPQAVDHFSFQQLEVVIDRIPTPEQQILVVEIGISR